MKYQAVLFDFDYTLGDATESIYEGFTYGFAQMGWPRPDREAVRRTVGYLLEDAVGLLMGEVSPEQKAEFRRHFQSKVEHTQAEKTRLFPGAVELLNVLHAQGCKTGIVTSKRVGTLKSILERYGLLDQLDFVIGGEEVKAPKPDPEGLRLGMAALGVEPGQVLYCGDTVLDAGAAQNAGVDFAAVLGGTTGAEAFEAFPHVFVARDLEALKTWLAI